MKPNGGRRRYLLPSAQSSVEPCEPARNPDPEASSIWPSRPHAEAHRGGWRSPQGNASRLPGRPPRGTVVTLLEYGSVGCSVGCYLADLGRDLIVVDRDVVEAVSIERRRTGHPERIIGMPKAAALAPYLQNLKRKTGLQ